jgi:hypothetical protein
LYLETGGRKERAAAGTFPKIMGTTCRCHLISVRGRLPQETESHGLVLLTANSRPLCALGGLPRGPLAGLFSVHVGAHPFWTNRGSAVEHGHDAGGGLLTHTHATQIYTHTDAHSTVLRPMLFSRHRRRGPHFIAPFSVGLPLPWAAAKGRGRVSPGHEQRTPGTPPASFLARSLARRGACFPRHAHPLVAPPVRSLTRLRAVLDVFAPTTRQERPFALVAQPAGGNHLGR